MSAILGSYTVLVPRAWIPDVILFERKTISLTFELWSSLGIPRPAPSAKNFSALGASLGIPSEPRSSKVRLIVLLSNRMTSGIHAHRKGNEDFSDTGKPTLLCCIPSKVLIGIKILQYWDVLMLLKLAFGHSAQAEVGKSINKWNSEEVLIILDGTESF